jgi:outer membrane protein, heavy metal efflux system
MRYFVAAFMVVATLGWSAEPTAPLTLDAAIAEALQKNPELRALGADVASARGEVTTANTWDNPELLVQPGVRDTKNGGQSTTEFHGVFELKQTIEFPGKRRLRRALAEKNVEVRQLALDAFRTQLAIVVRHAFYTLRLSQETVALRVHGVTLASEFVAGARKRVESGFASEFDATKADVELVSTQKALHETRAQAMSARAALNTWLGRKPDAELNVTGTLDANLPPLAETNLLAQVLARNPGIKVQEAEVERTGLSLQSVRKSRWPDFSIGPSVEYLQDEQTYDVGISLPLPLWDSKKGGVASATAEQEKAVAELEKLRREVVRDVTSAYHNLQAARESLALYTPGLRDKLKADLDAATQGYSDGRTSLLNYLEVRRTYFDTQADYLDALQKLHDAQAALETAIGVPLADLQEKTK